MERKHLLQSEIMPRGKSWGQFLSVCPMHQVLFSAMRLSRVKKTSFECRRNHIDKLRSRSMIFVSVGWVTYVGMSDNNYLRLMLIVIGPMLQEAYTLSPSPKRSSPESDSHHIDSSLSAHKRQGWVCETFIRA